VPADTTATGFLAALEREIAGEALTEVARAQSSPETQEAVELPPFRGGWVVFLGYQIAAEIEAGLGLPAAPATALQAAALRVPAALAWDHQRRRGFALVEDADESLLRQLQSAVGTVAAAASDAAGAGAFVPLHLPQLLVEDAPDQFRAMVRGAQEHIRAGDIYQANLSRAWRTSWPQGAQPADLYRALRHSNPAPFAAWARLPGLEILSSSPERLVTVRGSRVSTRPIAGTRPRLASGDSAQEISALLTNTKERAEHVMLIDLERNDLGRVCAGGSVWVEEFMQAESYAHVHHIVSNVAGRLRSGCGPVAVLRALFPGGTITGCPKIRCMQIIAQLEGVARGAYTGLLGYINRDGSMDSNILIRTFTIADGQLSFRAGAGIVADSDVERELAETRAKARGLLRALGQGA
jgi:anthranilate synthase component 1